MLWTIGEIRQWRYKDGVYTNPNTGRPIRIRDYAKIGGRAKIGDYVKIGAHAKIGDNVKIDPLKNTAINVKIQNRWRTTRRFARRNLFSASSSRANPLMTRMPITFSDKTVTNASTSRRLFL